MVEHDKLKLTLLRRQLVRDAEKYVVLMLETFSVLALIDFMLFITCKNVPAKDDLEALIHYNKMETYSEFFERAKKVKDDTLY
jgi:hypothetical protein